MTTLLADLSALINALSPAIMTTAGAVVAMVVVFVIVAPFYELGRFERRWYED